MSCGQTIADLPESVRNELGEHLGEEEERRPGVITKIAISLGIPADEAIKFHSYNVLAQDKSFSVVQQKQCIEMLTRWDRECHAKLSASVDQWLQDYIFTFKDNKPICAALVQKCIEIQTRIFQKTK